MPKPIQLKDADDFGAVISAVALNASAGSRTAVVTLGKRLPTPISPTP